MRIIIKAPPGSGAGAEVVVVGTGAEVVVAGVEVVVAGVVVVVAGVGSIPPDTITDTGKPIAARTIPVSGNMNAISQRCAPFVAVAGTLTVNVLVTGKSLPSPFTVIQPAQSPVISGDSMLFSPMVLFETVTVKEAVPPADTDSLNLTGEILTADAVVIRRRIAIKKSGLRVIGSTLTGLLHL